VFADRARLVQAFYNLIGNAAKYTDPGGDVRVAVETVDSTIMVRIRDTGVGIPPDMIERVFELFTQADRTVSRAQGGLGIGLTLVRRIIDAHGGTVTASSAGRGRGSEFIVTLPALTAPVADASGPPAGTRSSDAATSAHRVVVADDNKDAADTTAMMLRTLGHEVRACYDGYEALEAGASFRPDTMLLDIGMPGLSGYELARRIRSEAWGAKVKLIAVTGWGQAEDRQRSMEAGFDRHLVKPVQLRDLREAIESGRGARTP
jgi:CheY-like chemotaxis protein/anti-sigma regulatory factor (Ser/Thr protein kinase)